MIEALAKLGYEDDRTAKIDLLGGEGDPFRLKRLVEQIGAQRPDVIIAITSPAVVALKDAKLSIPVVFAFVPDPVGLGIVESFAHPGGTFTGVTYSEAGVGGKRLELLLDAVAGTTRIAVLLNPSFPGHATPCKVSARRLRSGEWKSSPVNSRAWRTWNWRSTMSRSERTSRCFHGRQRDVWKPEAGFADLASALRKGFRDLGYVEGKNLELENRFPDEQPERFRALAMELVESKVDVIVAVAGIGGKEAKQATSTIPIVIATDPDPVGNGLVQSLAHPGGNVTGLSLMIIDLSDKRLGLFKELVPNLSRLAILVDPRDGFSTRIRAGYEKAAKAIGLRTQRVEVTNRRDIDRAFFSIAQNGFDGAAVVGPMLLNERVQVGVSALAHKIPTLSGIAEMAQRGVLLSYGQDVPDYMRRAAGYVDKILKGAKPADLPIEQPTRFKLVINVKTAKALGLTVPPPLLATADEVIE